MRLNLKRKVINLGDEILARVLVWWLRTSLGIDPDRKYTIDEDD